MTFTLVYTVLVKNFDSKSAVMSYFVVLKQVNCLANRVLFDGQNAVGVEYIQSGSLKQVFASSEVILSGGAINTPQLLMLSGLGKFLLTRYFLGCVFHVVCYFFHVCC